MSVLSAASVASGSLCLLRPQASGSLALGLARIRAPATDVWAPAAVSWRLAAAVALVVVATSGCGDSKGSPDAADVVVDLDVDAGDDTAAAEVVDSAVEEAVAPPCEPTCPLAACASDDGCGSVCPPCPTSLSCGDCPLRIEVVDRVVQDGIVRRFSLLLLFVPDDLDPLPEIADIRIGVEGPAKLLSVEAGEPLLDAGKELLGDPGTGEVFQLLNDDAVIRVVVASVDAVATIGGGQWLRYDFRLGGAFEVAEEPAVLRIRKDEAIFAPPPAEAQLWGPGLDDPVAIWPDEPK